MTLSQLSFLLILVTLCHGKDTCVYVDYIEKKVNHSDIECRQNEICSREFKISYINFVPYVLHHHHHHEHTSEHGMIIEEILTKCCGSCVAYHEIQRYANITELTSSNMRQADFLYPFFGTENTKKLFGFYYLPTISVPTTMYITRAGEEMTLFESIAKLYPLVLICLIMAVAAGFIAWIIETWSNKEEFPRPFLIGWFEGFWWSFISMTTVGYGDKTPSSIPARIFSVLWILMGIVTFEVLSGELTGRIIAINTPKAAMMKDHLVGTLRFRDHEALVIAEHGGHIVWNEDATDLNSDILEMITKLKTKQIDGFLLNKWMLAYVTYLCDPKDIRFGQSIDWDTKDFFLKSTMRTEILYKGEPLTYGILVKDRHHYEYFKDFVQDIKLRHKIVGARFWNDFRRNITDRKIGLFYTKTSNNLLSPSGPYFMPALIGLIVMLGTMIVFGFIYELNRRHRRINFEVKLKQNGLSGIDRLQTVSKYS